MSWPSRIQKTLFEKVKEISDLDEDGDTEEKRAEKTAKIEETVKNDQSTTITGSG